MPYKRPEDRKAQWARFAAAHRYDPAHRARKTMNQQLYVIRKRLREHVITV